MNVVIIVSLNIDYSGSPDQVTLNGMLSVATVPWLSKDNRSTK
ncbi:hypothetical protein QWZ16_22880 [Vibrio ostreicida]|uniref:Uncharacterized protein n=1 Tax=Vibrio ostreicida TaxID=526588 RepID=A0ABT8C0I6_9VIBR|nr:hypothetical protein [Vibrio ostreicida]MDN3612448.1 hypothetical protein [Vibrio ostreicida]